MQNPQTVYDILIDAVALQIISNNKANGGDGGVFSTEYGICTMRFNSNSSFHKNHAYHGGILQCQTLDIVIKDNVRLISNSANSEISGGGGCFAISISMTAVLQDNVQVIGNTSIT